MNTILNDDVTHYDGCMASSVLTLKIAHFDYVEAPKKESQTSQLVVDNAPVHRSHVGHADVIEDKFEEMRRSPYSWISYNHTFPHLS